MGQGKWGVSIVCLNPWRRLGVDKHGVLWGRCLLRVYLWVILIAIPFVISIAVRCMESRRFFNSKYLGRHLLRHRASRHSTEDFVGFSGGWTSPMYLGTAST